MNSLVSIIHKPLELFRYETNNMISKLRLICQITILLGIIFVTYLNHYENQKMKYGGHLIIEKSRVLRTMDKIAGKWENRSKIMRYVQGDVWAAQIGSVKIVDPLSFFGNLTRTKKIYGMLFKAALITIVATLILGKVFCSWICPMGLFFEINDHIRKRLIKAGVPLLNWRLPQKSKYIVLGLGLLSGLIFGAHYFFIIYPPKLLCGEIYFWVTRSSFSFSLLFLFVYLTAELFFAPRLWCQSLCPGGAIYTLLSKFRIIRIKNNLKACINCGICDKACPYQITPSKGHLSAQCDHCSICIDKCPVNTLSFIVGKDRELSPK